MRDVVFSPRAVDDLDQIWTYSVDRWDVEQADAYVRSVVNACNGLASGTLLGRSAEDIRTGYRKYAVVSHIVFYRETATTLHVVRVLHQRMDVLKHLEEA